MSQIKGPLCYIDVSLDSQQLERIIFELNLNTPKTNQYFLGLLSHDNPAGIFNTSFHRVVKNFIIQAGDLSTKYPESKQLAEHETLIVENELINEHLRAGILSMAESGSTISSSQFFITLSSQPQLNSKHAAFGRVIYGMNTVRLIEGLECVNYKPNLNATIVGGGTLSHLEDGLIIPKDGDYLCDFASDHYLEIETNELEYLNLAKIIKESGSYYLKLALKSRDGGQLLQARDKYLKAIRYIDFVDPTPIESESLSLSYKDIYVQLKVQILNNLSMTALEQKDYLQAMAYSQRVLEMQQAIQAANLELNVTLKDLQKAMYRIGLCLFEMGESEKSLNILNDGLKMGADVKISGLISTIEDRKHLSKLKEQQVLKKMFGGI